MSKPSLAPSTKASYTGTFSRRRPAEQQQDAEQRQVAQQRGQRGDGGGRHAGQQRHEAAQRQRAAAQPGQHHRIRQFQALAERHRQEAGQRGGASGQQNGQEHQRRIGRALLRAEHEQRHRQQRQRRGIEHQEQDLRVAGGVGLGIERLQLAHGAQADGRGRVVQAQAVGGEVQRDQADGGMVARHLGHQAREQRAEQPRQPFHHPRPRRCAGIPATSSACRTAAPHFNRHAGHIEQAGDHGAEDLGVADGEPAVGAAAAAARNSARVCSACLGPDGTKNGPRGVGPARLGAGRGSTGRPGIVAESDGPACRASAILVL